MTFSDAVTTTTRTFIVPKVFDTISKGSPTLMKLLQTAVPWRTGFKYEFPIKFQDSTNGGNVGVADKLDTDRQDVRVTASFEPKMATKPVVVANIETTLNMGDERIVDLLETEFDSQGQSLMELMASNVFSGTGVGNSWDSIDNAADDGTNFSTYGSLSRTTFPSLNGFFLASTGALTLAKLATAYDAVEIGTDKPDMIVTTKALWSAYEALLTPTVRAGYTQNGFPRMNAFGGLSQSQALAGTQGFEVLWYRGTPFIKDEHCPSGKLFLINSNFFGMKGIKIIAKNIETLNFKKLSDGVPLGVPGRVPSTMGFNFRNMMSPVDQLAEVGHLIYAGNFISTNPRLQGQMTGVTA